MAAKKQARAVRIAAETESWVKQLLESGAVLRDAKGRARLEPRAAALLDALHELLAGGEVEIRVKRAGDKARREALRSAFAGALEASNELAADDPEILIP